MFFILTNSRAFSKEKTIRVHQEIARNIAQAARESGKKFLVISRGDSTLRGHYPTETETLKTSFTEAAGLLFDGEIIIPFFQEGGRFTVKDVHYVKEGMELIPAGDTEFARDKTFGYRSSDLKEYVEEKTRGKYKAADVVSIALEDLRSFDVTKIKNQLMDLTAFHKVVVNAVEYIDIKVFTIALIEALLEGKNFLYRTAAAFPKVISGMGDQDLLESDQLRGATKCGGIIIVGSYVKKTTDQLQHLMENVPDLQYVEFDTSRIREENGRELEVERIIQRIEPTLRSGKSAVVFTSRQPVQTASNDPDAILEASVQISDSLVSIIGRLTIQPGYIIAKGGITSSDVGTKALSVKKAEVVGQVSPGIPVWMTGNESKFPMMPYIIFPGNVGDTGTLTEVVRKLEGDRDADQR